MSETRYEAIKDCLDNMSTADLVGVHNEYIENTNNYDDQIFDMYEFDEICQGMSPPDIAQRIYYGDFRICDDYFRYNGYANFESFDYADDEKSGIYTSDIARYIDEEEEDLGNREIKNLLEEWEEENEEEESEDEADEDDREESGEP